MSNNNEEDKISPKNLSSPRVTSEHRHSRLEYGEANFIWNGTRLYSPMNSDSVLQLFDEDNVCILE